MVRGVDNRPQLGTSYALPTGLRLTLRVARPSDAGGIQRLLGDLGIELDLLELVRFDPRRRVVVCATSLIGSTETVLGVGAIELDGAAPDLLIVDEWQAEGLAELLQGALLARAAISQRALRAA